MDDVASDSAVEVGPPLPTPSADARKRAHDRADEADLLLDVSQLTVDEIMVELQASVGIDHVKLDAKGLNAGLFLKASLDNLVALRTSTPPPRRSDAAGQRTRRPDARALPAAEGISDGHDDAPGTGHEADHAERGGHEDGIHGVLEEVRRRAGTVAKEGGKAASVAVLGAAGGALLESRFGRHQGPSLPRRLSGRRTRGPRVPTLVSAAPRAPKALIETVQRHLP